MGFEWEYMKSNLKHASIEQFPASVLRYVKCKQCRYVFKRVSIRKNKLFMLFPPDFEKKDSYRH